MNDLAISFAIATVSIFLLTVLAEHILIPILRSHKLGQRILDIGPRWHKSKEGTPIMGGIGFILAAMIVMAVFFIIAGMQGIASEYLGLSLTLAFAVANGAIGFVDDYCKLVKKQNEGLTRLQKLILQIAVTVGYVCIMIHTGNMPSSVQIPFTELYFGGVAWYVLAVLILVGVINGANFTDGIDGLASSVSAVIGVFYAVVAFLAQNQSLSMVGALLIGATFGFLIYNFHPARVFMGDTGSLFLGALIIGSAFSFGDPLVALIVCGVFVFELLSSALQILYFRLTKGKRLFKMAPFHHHLEQCGWSENTIVAVFSGIEALLCALAYFVFGF